MFRRERVLVNRVRDLSRGPAAAGGPRDLLSLDCRIHLPRVFCGLDASAPKVVKCDVKRRALKKDPP